jgi:hypothetical protein
MEAIGNNHDFSTLQQQLAKNQKHEQLTTDGYGFLYATDTVMLTYHFCLANFRI